MNREIKFRAWDKTYSLMNYKVQVGNTDYADQNYTCNSIWVDYGDNKSIGWMNADENCIDLMQFTGLKDKNGKEIYEGDIVFNHAEEGRSNSNTIIWDNDRYVIEQLSTQDDEINGIGIYLELYLFNEDIEVIGNIYETPELLSERS